MLRMSLMRKHRKMRSLPSIPVCAMCGAHVISPRMANVNKLVPSATAAWQMLCRMPSARNLLTGTAKSLASAVRSEERRVGKESATRRWKRDWSSDVCSSDLIDEEASQDAVFTVDTGMCNVWGARYITPNGEREQIGSFRHGSMANALPHAIGAQFADRDRQVISFSG